MLGSSYQGLSNENFLNKCEYKTLQWNGGLPILDPLIKTRVFTSLCPRSPAYPYMYQLHAHQTLLKALLSFITAHNITMTPTCCPCTFQLISQWNIIIDLNYVIRAFISLLYYTRCNTYFVCISFWKESYFYSPFKYVNINISCTECGNKHVY